MRQMKALFTLLILFLPQAAAGAALALSDAYVRATPPGATVAAAYLTISNNSEHEVALKAASSPLAQAVEFHEHVMQGDMMRMQPMPQVSVPANGALRFQPGGNHVMLIGLKRELVVGEQVPITLRFSNGETLTLQAEVRDMRRRMQHEH